MKNSKKTFKFPFLSDQSGSVLILTAWSVSLLGMISIIFGSSTFFSLATMKRMNDQLESYALARAAIPYALNLLNNEDKTKGYDGTGDAWSLGGEVVFREQPLGDGVFSLSYERFDPAGMTKENRFGIGDEESKLNLNAASTDTLKKLFALLTSLKESQIESLVDCIADWRDTDSDKRPDGAENSDYRSLRPPYEPKNGDFESLEELLFVKGMTGSVFEEVRPYLTVYGSGKVNVNTAPTYVLMALGLSEAGAETLLFNRHGNDGIAETEDDVAASSVAAISGELGRYLSFEDMNILGKLIARDALSVSSEVFFFTADGRSSTSEHPVKIQCVLKRSGEILAWQEE